MTLRHLRRFTVRQTNPKLMLVKEVRVESGDHPTRKREGAEIVAIVSMARSACMNGVAWPTVCATKTHTRRASPRLEHRAGLSSARGRVRADPNWAPAAARLSLTRHRGLADQTDVSTRLPGREPRNSTGEK